MKKSRLLLCCIFLFLAVVLSGCSWADRIEEGTYVCKTPYIKLTYDYSAKYMITQEIEVDEKVYKAIAETGHGKVFFYEYQDEDVKPSDGLRTDDNEIYAIFYYKFDNNKKQLILTDQETGNRYYLDKVE